MKQTICDITDINKLDTNTKYVTVDIANVDNSLISYLKENARDCLFTDRIDSKRGFVYVDYNIFLNAQNIIENIIKNIPSDLSQLEIARYLYISLGKIIGYNINLEVDKKAYLNYNNIWNATVMGSANNISLSKLYLYLCSLANIKCSIIRTSDNYYANKLIIDNKDLIINLSKDNFYIQANFPTVAFSSYNKDYAIDRKIGYIKDEYNDTIIDKELSKLDQFSDKFVEQILMKTQYILKVDNIKAIELGLIYKYIFDKYCPDSQIYINNLYVNEKEKQHFILITYNNYHYSYNYKKHSFVSVSEFDLISNIENKKLGLYDEEVLPIKNNALSL